MAFSFLGSTDSTGVAVLEGADGQSLNELAVFEVIQQIVDDLFHSVPRSTAVKNQASRYPDDQDFGGHATPEMPGENVWSTDPTVVLLQRKTKTPSLTNSNTSNGVYELVRAESSTDDTNSRPLSGSWHEKNDLRIGFFETAW